MKFCELCSNMLYIRNIHDHDTDVVCVEHYCKFCHKVEDYEALSDTATQKTIHAVPKYISNDVTLPRRKIECECGNQELILIRQNNIDKIYNHYCDQCDRTQ